MQWWTEARFGMFIHWGLYALAARHEWVKQRERIPDEVYQKYFDHFDPDLYDPAAWARMAKAAGMKYVVLTTKHHEGFCLWDSRYTDYKAPNTPCGRDLLRPFVDAFRAEGLRVGFYYSLIDWHHPEFPVDRVHPMWTNDEFKRAHAGRDVRKYADYLYHQVEELMTDFGTVDVLFLDFSYPDPQGTGKGHEDWRSERLLKMIRRRQPGIIVNDRLDWPGFDFVTPEQVMVRRWPERDGRRVPWETCQTFSGSWGYHRDEATWKDERQLLALLIDTVGKGGNLLLNVGPTARGTFDARAAARLEAMGRWMHVNGRSIYGCTQPPDWVKPPEHCRATWNPATGRLYLHLFDWPLGTLYCDGLGGRIEYAQILSDASEVGVRTGPGGHWLSREQGITDETAILSLPVLKPADTVPVIEIFLKR
ncbi:MAG: alpha-L-fucosidase [bacterium]|nr:alpha-L-fucosidase [bacterium]